MAYIVERSCAGDALFDASKPLDKAPSGRGPGSQCMSARAALDTNDGVGE